MKLHGAVYDRLRVDQYLYAVGGDTEKPFGLDDLKAFVHHTCTVDGDLRSHIPGGMAQGIRLGDVGQLVEREGPERSPAGCEKDFLDLIVSLTHDALENGGVLTVDRDDGCMVLLGQLTDQFSGHHQCFLVGKADFLAGFDGMDGG